jgi:hypothetical protein
MQRKKLSKRQMPQAPNPKLQILGSKSMDAATNDAISKTMTDWFEQQQAKAS